MYFGQYSLKLLGIIVYLAKQSYKVPTSQSVVGLQEGDPIYWEPGKLRLRLHHIFSKQALAVSQLSITNVSDIRRDFICKKAGLYYARAFIASVLFQCKT